MTKKIGVLTFHYADNMNFGASLQSYAICKMLSKLNDGEIELIDYNPRKLGLYINYVVETLKITVLDFLKLQKSVKQNQNLKN